MALTETATAVWQGGMDGSPELGVGCVKSEMPFPNGQMHPQMRARPERKFGSCQNVNETGSPDLGEFTERVSVNREDRRGRGDVRRGRRVGHRSDSGRDSDGPGKARLGGTHSGGVGSVVTLVSRVV